MDGRLERFHIDINILFLWPGKTAFRGHGIRYNIFSNALPQFPSNIFSEPITILIYDYYYHTVRYYRPVLKWFVIPISLLLLLLSHHVCAVLLTPTAYFRGRGWWGTHRPSVTATARSPSRTRVRVSSVSVLFRWQCENIVPVSTYCFWRNVFLVHIDKLLSDFYFVPLLRCKFHRIDNTAHKSCFRKKSHF